MKTLPEIIKLLKTYHEITHIDFVGSRITCYPIPTNSDQDILILTNNLTTLLAKLTIIGFNIGGSIDTDLNDNDFVSLKLDYINLIITASPKFRIKFLAATELTTKLNILNKQHRIDLFQLVLYENGALGGINILTPETPV